MDALEAIFTRRSIRKFESAPVSDELIDKIIRAGMAAPSAGNQQPWHFIIINDRYILDEIQKFHPYSKMLAQSPVAILVCGDIETEKHKGYWIQDCSAAVENMLIAIHAMGLGAVWLGIHPREDRVEGIRKLINMPNNINPLALIAMGYPAEKQPPADRYNKSKIHINKW